MRRIIVVVLVLAVAAVGFWKFRDSRAAEPTSYRLVEITKGNLASVVAATGNLQPVTTVQVGTQVSGIVESQNGFHILKRTGFDQQVFILFSDDAIAGAPALLEALAIRPAPAPSAAAADTTPAATPEAQPAAQPAAKPQPSAPVAAP